MPKKHSHRSRVFILAVPGVEIFYSPETGEVQSRVNSPRHATLSTESTDRPRDGANKKDS